MRSSANTQNALQYQGPLNINRNDTLVLNGGVLDTAYSGTMNLGSGATFSRDVAWAFDGTLYTVVGSTLGSFTAPATIAGVGSFTQAGGSINVDAGETLQISSSTFTVTNGTLNNSGHIIFDTGTSISGATFNMTGPTASLTLNPGVVVSIVSNDLEVDGAGTATNIVTIGNNASLFMNLSGAADKSFAGRMDLNGGVVGAGSDTGSWTLGGTLNVSGASLIGIVVGTAVTFNGQVNIGSNSSLAIYPNTVYGGATFTGATGTLYQNAQTTVAATKSVEVRTYDWDLSPTTTAYRLALVSADDHYDVVSAKAEEAATNRAAARDVHDDLAHAALLVSAAAGSSVKR